MISRTAYRLCIITDPDLARGLSLLEIVERGIEGGAPMIQLRHKRASQRELLPQARLVASLCRDRRTCFIVNDRLDMAEAVDADGVHLGQDDLPPSAARALLGPGKILGVSTHSLDQALRAADDGADYLGIGPVFGTATKSTGYKPLGCDVIRQVRLRIDLPLLAIGGITLDNVGDVIRAGATGAAVISAIVASNNVANSTRAFLAAIQSAEQGQ